MVQPEYKILKAAFEYGLPKEAVHALFENQDAIRKKGFKVEELFKEMMELFPNSTKIKAEFFEYSKDIPDPRSLSSTDKNLIIFDGVMLEKQNKTESYYTRGRHHNIDCFYLTQIFLLFLKEQYRKTQIYFVFFLRKK